MSRRTVPVEEKLFIEWLMATPEQRLAFDQLVRGSRYEREVLRKATAPKAKKKADKPLPAVEVA